MRGSATLSDCCIASGSFLFRGAFSFRALSSAMPSRRFVVSPADCLPSKNCARVSFVSVVPLSLLLLALCKNQKRSRRLPSSKKTSFRSEFRSFCFVSESSLCLFRITLELHPSASHPHKKKTDHHGDGTRRRSGRATLPPGTRRPQGRVAGRVGGDRFRAHVRPGRRGEFWRFFFGGVSCSVRASLFDSLRRPSVYPSADASRSTPARKVHGDSTAQHGGHATKHATLSDLS